MKPRRKDAIKQGGFGYLLLLFALATMGLILSGLGQSWTMTRQREREAELIFIGKQFSAALASYRTQTPGGQPDKPAALQDLIEDKRFPFPVRHLRQIFRDPMTGKRDWELQLAEGHITGIRSSSEQPALRRTLPDYVVMPTDSGESVNYHDWIFVAPRDEAHAAPPAMPGRVPASPMVR
ncbi:MAG: hypothetical protein JWL63_2745 [Rhodocyclales bacterium]|nr:hypothetical protein [Rhodocyclales bacterium]